MEKVSLEIKRTIWSNITNDDDLRSCALVNWEWYSRYFGREAIGVPKKRMQRGNWLDMLYGRAPKKPGKWTNGAGYKPFISDSLVCYTEEGLAPVYSSVTQLMNQYQKDKAEWYNRAYTPYILELNLQFLQIDLSESGLKFTGLKTIIGDARQLLALFTATDVITPGQLRNLSVRMDSQSVPDEVVQLFDELGKFNIDNLQIQLRGRVGMPKIAIKKTVSSINFFRQLSRLTIRGIYFGAEMFQYLSNLKFLSMEDVYVNCKDCYETQAQPQDLFVAHDYLGEICENINKFATKIESVTFRDRVEVLKVLAMRGLELISSAGKVEHIAIKDYMPENRKDINIFTLNLDPVRDFAPFAKLKKLEGLSVYHASTLSKLGLACRQLEAIRMQIEVDFTRVNAPKGTILFPNLIRSDERIVSLSKTKCICSFVKTHMPRVKFDLYGTFCVHCFSRTGEDRDFDPDPMYPKWTGFLEI